MDATDLLKQMADVYSGLHGYVDQGAVVVTFIEAGGRRVDRRPFRTAFLRPQRFRYEFNDESSGMRLAIWQDGALAKLSWTEEPGVKSLPLALAIASATGVSGGSALTVPSLLMPDLFRGLAAPIQADTPEVHSEMISDVRCLRMAVHQGPQPLTLWLDADDLLIRRIVQTAHFGRKERDLVASLPRPMQAGAEERLSYQSDFDTETESTYLPRLNPAIQADEFAVDPSTMNHGGAQR